MSRRTAGWKWSGSRPGVHPVHASVYAQVVGADAEEVRYSRWPPPSAPPTDLDHDPTLISGSKAAPSPAARACSPGRRYGPHRPETMEHDPGVAVGAGAHGLSCVLSAGSFRHPQRTDPREVLLLLHLQIREFLVPASSLMTTGTRIASGTCQRDDWLSSSGIASVSRTETGAVKPIPSAPFSVSASAGSPMLAKRRTRARRP